MKKKLVYFCIAITISLAIGALSGFATQGSAYEWYSSLKKPGYNPTPWVFTLIWTILYALMGLSAGLVLAKGFHHVWVKSALYHFGLQLLFNALWALVFFGSQNPFWGLLVILCLLVILLFTIKWFNVVSKTAAFLLIPYFLWICFIALLNYRIWELN
ncbi:MAG: TspO/MBR family protein [Cellulophaga sp.]